jgi:hypothetical protein
VLDFSKINSELVSDYHQSLMKQAEHNKVQLIWALGLKEMRLLTNWKNQVQQTHMYDLNQSAAPLRGSQSGPGLGVQPKIL